MIKMAHVLMALGTTLNHLKCVFGQLSFQTNMTTTKQKTMVELDRGAMEFIQGN